MLWEFSVWRGHWYIQYIQCIYIYIYNYTDLHNVQYMCTSAVSKMLGRHHWSLVQWLEGASSYELVPLKYTTQAETIKEFWWHKKRVHCCHCNVESSEEIYQNLVNTRYLDTFVFFHYTTTRSLKWQALSWCSWKSESFSLAQGIPQNCWKKRWAWIPPTKAKHLC